MFKACTKVDSCRAWTPQKLGGGANRPTCLVPEARFATVNLDRDAVTSSHACWLMSPSCSPLQNNGATHAYRSLQVIAEGMETAAIFVRHSKSQALLHCKQLKPCCGIQLVFGIPLLETFATPPEICKYLSGFFQGAKPFDTRRRWSGRD